MSLLTDKGKYFSLHPWSFLILAALYLSLSSSFCKCYQTIRRNRASGRCRCRQHSQAHQGEELLDRLEHSQAHQGEELLDRLERLKHLNAFWSIEKANLLSHRDLGPSSIPFAVKDNICTAGVTTTAGSKILENHVSSFDATCVRKLKDCGSILVGKTSCDEFAMGSTSLSTPFLTPLNPRNTSRSTGGSSGGSAAAVAANLVPVALGSDTGGSVRQPAAWCGVVGLKPTYGRVSRYGLIEFSSSMDCVGIIGNSVSTCAKTLKVISGRDWRDPSSQPMEIPDYHDDLIRFLLRGGDKPLGKFRLATIREAYEFCDLDVQEAYSESLELLKYLGAEITEISFPNLQEFPMAYYAISCSEASSNLARYDGLKFGSRVAGKDALSTMQRTRQALLGFEVKLRVVVGSYLLANRNNQQNDILGRAERIRSKLRDDLASLFDKTKSENFLHGILSPTSTTTARPIEELLLRQRKKQEIASLSQDNEADLTSDLFTVLASLVGAPAISVPCRVSTKNNLPIGLQIIGSHFCESSILEIAGTYETFSSHVSVAK